MALTLKEAAALTVIGLDEAMLKGQGVAARTIKGLGRAAVKLAPYTVPAARTAASTTAYLAAANPVSTGIGLGAATLASPVGQDLLAAAEERGKSDRVRLQQAIDERIYAYTVAKPQSFKAGIESPVFKPAIKRRVSKYQKAVKAGMSAVKRSKFLGAKGKISNAKTAFTRVNKIASAVNKGKKVGSKGVTGVIKRAVGRYL